MVKQKTESSTWARQQRSQYIETICGGVRVYVRILFVVCHTERSMLSVGWSCVLHAVRQYQCTCETVFACVSNRGDRNEQIKSSTQWNRESTATRRCTMCTRVLDRDNWRWCMCNSQPSHLVFAHFYFDVFFFRCFSFWQAYSVIPARVCIVF